MILITRPEDSAKKLEKKLREFNIEYFTESLSVIKFKVKNLNDFENIKMKGVKFLKGDSSVTAVYDKNKFKFDEIIKIVKENAEIIDISTDDGDLEDIFLQITNK